jgi:hypothetical protein
MKMRGEGNKAIRRWGEKYSEGIGRRGEGFNAEFGVRNVES